MLDNAPRKTSWIARLDHVICEVDDIERAVTVFKGLGFPCAWPVGRFWPTGLTAGIALGGFNLEFIQPDAGGPADARIRTLVFEPRDLGQAETQLAAHHIRVRQVDKVEPDPGLLKLRGFDAAEAQTPQLICRNLYPEGQLPIDFFVCDYAPKLKDRLAPTSFPDVPSVMKVTLRLSSPAVDCTRIEELFGPPWTDSTIDIAIDDQPGPLSEVVEIQTERGPLSLGSWKSRFRLT